METINVALDPGAYMPTRAHEWDAGLDLYAMRDMWIRPQSSEFFNTGVHVQIPRGFAGLVKSRSGLMRRNDSTTDGTIDADYTGSIGVSLFNHGRADLFIKAGDRIAQLVIVPCLRPKLQVVAVSELEETERGDSGFGSTGK